MSKVFLLALLSIGLVFAVALTGCSQQQAGDQSSPATNASSGDSAMAGHEGHDHAAGGEMAHDDSGTSKYEEALAKLSPADRELAEKQKVCPVSGEPLGAMGPPYKVTVKDREVFLCCPGCESKIKENPDEYLAKLDQ